MQRIVKCNERRIIRKNERNLKEYKSKIKTWKKEKPDILLKDLGSKNTREIENARYRWNRKKPTYTVESFHFAKYFPLCVESKFSFFLYAFF